MLLPYFWLVWGFIVCDKREGFIVFRFFFATLCQCFALFAEISHLVKNYGTNFRRMETNGKIVALYEVPHVLRSSKIWGFLVYLF